jgi:RHS repeat-associated protein
VNLPFPFVPLPHPYIGLVIDPFDYIPFIGATVKVNNVPRGNSDTAGMLITFIHIPFGAGFTLVPMIGHDSSNFFGSKTVSFEGSGMSGAGYVLMTCNDIGIPLSLDFAKKPGKKIIPIPSLYLPTSFVIPLQWGKPVRIGGPMVPQFDVEGFIHAFGFSCLLKAVGKRGKKLLTALNHKVLKKHKSTKKLGDLFCKMGFEPVDLITGRVNYEYTDFELPGPIPLRWIRNWDSDSSITGPLGHGIQLSYDRCVKLWPEEGCLSVTLADGRLAIFPMLHYGESYYHPQEKMLLRRKQNGHFLLEDYNESLYYHFNHDPEPGTWQLSFIENYSGNRIQLHYAGRALRAMTDCAGRQLLFELDKQQRITRVEVSHRNRRQVLVSYTYNEEGDLISIADALNQVTALEYRDHLMVKKTDRNGHNFYWEYDEKRRCIHTWGDGGVMEGFIQFHKGYNVVTNSLEENTIYYFDENNMCIQETDHYGNHRYTEYTDDAQLYREIDEEGNITGYTYDENGRLKENIFPDGSSIQFSYNEYNQLMSTVFQDGRHQTYGYDAMRRLRFITFPNGNSTYYEYNEEGQMAAVIENNQKIRMSYDEDENLVSIQLPNEGTAYWKYDEFGRCIQTINATGQTRFLEYDALNRVRTLHLPDGNTIQLDYNAYEDITHLRDHRNNVYFEYTALRNLKKRRQNNSEFTFLYDSHERLCAFKDEGGKHYTFDYNKRGEIITETGFDGLQRHYERDATGKVIKTVRPGGRYTQFEYDANGRVIRSTYHDGSWEAFNYTRIGHIKEATNEYCTVKFDYNKQQMVDTEYQDGYTINSVYDNQGDRMQITSSLGADIRVQRNALGLVTDMQAKMNDLVWQAQMKYNQAGYEIERMLPGGITSEWQYNNGGKRSEQKISKQGIVQSWKKYTWDTNDRLTNIFDALTQSNTHFKYDTLGNLVFAQYADNSIVHRSADEDGNVYETTQQTDRKYNTAGALLESRKYIYKYDEEGNLISKTTKGEGGKKTCYEWYANGRLHKVIRPDGKVVEFTYDALGRRIKKCFDGTITRWVWDGNVPLHEWKYDEKDQPKAVVNEWGEITYDKKEPNPASLPPDKTGITWIFEEDEYVPCAKIVNGKTYSLICDHIGTPKAAYDEKGNKVWECAVDIYGRANAIKGSKNFIPFRFQGQYEDEETGLYYNRFRYYAPEEGTYISQDPIRTACGVQMYSYVHDPNYWLDILGLVPIFDPGLAKIARAAHNMLLKKDKITIDTIAQGRRTVAVGEGILPNGDKQLFASGNYGTLTPLQRAKLIQMGVPEENIYSGAAVREIVYKADGVTIDKKATNLANHAERVIIRNAPAGTRFPRWGISWAKRQRNASCANCTPHVNCAS